MALEQVSAVDVAAAADSTLYGYNVVEIAAEVVVEAVVEDDADDAELLVEHDSGSEAEADAVDVVVAAVAVAHNNLHPRFSASSEGDSAM